LGAFNLNLITIERCKVIVHYINAKLSLISIFASIIVKKVGE